MIKTILTFILILFFGATSFATEYPSAAQSPLEYRLLKKDAPMPPKFESLEETSFMKGSDFKKAVASNPKNPNFPDKWTVEVLFSKKGKEAYTQMASTDRERTYCLVFEAEILQCSSFPPEVKGLYLKGSGQLRPATEGQAKNLAERINKSLIKTK